MSFRPLGIVYRVIILWWCCFSLLVASVPLSYSDSAPSLNCRVSTHFKTSNCSLKDSFRLLNWSFKRTVSLNKRAKLDAQTLACQVNEFFKGNFLCHVWDKCLLASQSVSSPRWILVSRYKEMNNWWSLDYLVQMVELIFFFFIWTNVLQ